MAFDYAAAFTDEKLQEIVRRIVEVADPVKVVLFGSAARGEMNRHSDADFLVVIEPGPKRIKTAQQIHRNLRRIGIPVDIIVVTTDDVDEYEDFPPSVVYPALKEGRVVHERRRDPTGGGPRPGPREGSLRDPQTWLDHARMNLAGASREVAGAELESLCPLALWAGSGALKALLIQRGVLDFPHGHDIPALINLSKRGPTSIPREVQQGVLLKKYTDAGYPPFRLSGRREYEDAVTIARAVVEWVEAQLQGDA